MSLRRVSAFLLRSSHEWEAHNGITYLHWCPGCKHAHPINVEKPNHCNAKWSFNGDVDAPEFSPSINIVGSCHYFIRRGRVDQQENPTMSYIDFCSDSRHEYAGKAVPLPAYPDMDPEGIG